MIRRAAALVGIALLAACSEKSAYPQPSQFGNPTGASRNLVIGAAGGSLTSADGLLTLTVPAGALSADVDLSITPITNTAPGGQGTAYRLGPDGLTFFVPATLTFQVASLAQPIDTLSVTFQDGSAYWLRLPTSRDPVATTITASTLHLSDWTVTTASSSRDLFGPISYSSTIDIPFTASGNGILNYAGEDANEVYYLAGGSLTVAPTLTVGTATCTVVTPTTTQRTSVAELFKSPPKFFYAMNGMWQLQCSDGTNPVIATTFDSEGISLFRCPRSYVGNSIISTSQLQGTMTIDCSADGQVTGSWDFTPCIPGVACASANGPCKTAAIVCTQNGPVCTDNGNVPNGTSCGSNQVCNGGSCVTCVAGDVCTTQPDTLCHVGIHDCSTGTQQCVNGAPLANGTICGTDMVCNAGVCSPCAAGQTCTGQPDPLCHAGTTSCSTGSSVCVNGAPLANGTTCGSNQVCNGGTCSTCVAGDACTSQPDQLCHLGVHDCSTGTQQCINGAALANGTSCGTNQVCNSGSCVACVAGDACTTQPDQLCHLGVHDCSTGTQQCVNGAALANGTACGTDQVCNGGACASCVAGDACTTQPDPLCHVGVHDCSTGTQQCINGAARSNGTTCGTDQVCNGGACVACVAGDVCTSQPDQLCHVGVHDCSTGALQCINGAALPDGTSCGAGQSCNAGACVPSRTVSVSREVTWWTDAGRTAPLAAPDVEAPPVILRAYVSNGPGSWSTYSGTLLSPGSLSVASVPSGAYLLQFTDGAGVIHLIDASADALDLGYDLLGRNNAAPATGATQVTLDLSGLVAWDPNGQLQITSSNADAWDVLASGGVAAGVTSASILEDWFSGNVRRGPLALLATGDVLYVHQLMPSLDAASGLAYLSAAAAGSVNSVTLTDQTALTVPVALSAATPSGSLAGGAWSLSAFEALLPAMNPLASTDAGAHSLTVSASPFPVGVAGPLAHGSPTLLSLQLPRGASPDPTLNALAYGQFLDPTLWTEWRGVDFTAHVSYTAPAATPLDVTVSVGRREAMPAATALSPTLTPVQSPTVNGLPAFSTLTGVTTTPVVAWTAPLAGAPSSYQVEVYRLDAVAGASVGTLVASWQTGATSIAFPPGVLAAGASYFARITANATSVDSFATAPFRRTVAAAYASTLTGSWSP